MTDRELLKRAAKAIGFNYPTWLPNENRYWNPLDDDGDALRLAVDLDMVPFLPCDYEPEDWRYDPFSATRLAIVRAAAEIGKELQ